jgi:hypothetical protein
MGAAYQRRHVSSATRLARLRNIVSAELVPAEGANDASGIEIPGLGAVSLTFSRRRGIERIMSSRRSREKLSTASTVGKMSNAERGLRSIM